jgi:predicted aspartyl protease
MTTTHFNPAGELIIVESKLWGPAGRARLSFALDTASSATVVAPHAVDDLGYSPRDGLAMTTVRSAVGREHGYTLKVARLAALGFAMHDFEVNVFDLATGHGIDGLIGLSFLKNFDYEIRSIVGRINVRVAVSDPRPS